MWFLDATKGATPNIIIFDATNNTTTVGDLTLIVPKPAAMGDHLALDRSAITAHEESMKSDSRPSEMTKAIRNARVCYRCATPVLDPDAIQCPRCGNSDIDARKARPDLHSVPESEGVRLPFPWSELNFEAGGTIMLSGNRGSGKTTLMTVARPDVIASSEQQQAQISQAWIRIHGRDSTAPLMTSCTSWEQLEEDLEALEEGQLFGLDSISQLAHGFDSGAIVNRCIETIRKKRARGIFIAQYTKDGGILGPNELQHLVDAVLEIPPDKKSGTRRLVARKNRFGGLFTTYFALSNRGPIEVSFDYAYSIEGAAGDYSLHLYPMGGAEWSGILEILHEKQVDLRGLAGAAIATSAYAGGFALPPDHEQRRMFAEAHGLTYVGPENFDDIVRERSDPDRLTPPSEMDPL